MIDQVLFISGDFVQPYNVINTGKEIVHPNKSYTVSENDSKGNVRLFETGTRWWHAAAFSKLIKEIPDPK